MCEGSGFLHIPGVHISFPRERVELGLKVVDLASMLNQIRHGYSCGTAPDLHRLRLYPFLSGGEGTLTTGLFNCEKYNPFFTHFDVQFRGSLGLSVAKGRNGGCWWVKPANNPHI
jgi:hypothetical protein